MTFEDFVWHTTCTSIQHSDYAQNLGDYHDESTALYYRIDFDEDESGVIDCIVNYCLPQDMTSTQETDMTLHTCLLTRAETRTPRDLASHATIDKTGADNASDIQPQ